MKVTLTWPEILLASQVGIMRRAQNMKLQNKHKYGYVASPSAGVWEMDIISSQAEMAVGKALNLYWTGSIGDYTAVDVGGLVEVRCSTRENPSLILHPDDKDNSPHVLVYADSPVFTLLGWIVGRDGKDQQYWRDPTGNRPAFFVPQEALEAMSELREYLAW